MRGKDRAVMRTRWTMVWKVERADVRPPKTRDREDGAGCDDGLDRRGARLVGEERELGWNLQRPQGWLHEAPPENKAGQARRECWLMVDK